VIGDPVLAVTVMCPVIVPNGSLAAVADTVRVAGLVELTELPEVKAADRKLGESVVTPLIVIGLGLVVERVTFCDPALCPESALNVSVEGFAAIFPTAGTFTTRVTGTVCTAPFEFSEIVPI
jgi:energy-converting hydrogenase Eha subunit A